MSQTFHEMLNSARSASVAENPEEIEYVILRWMKQIGIPCNEIETAIETLNRYGLTKEATELKCLEDQYFALLDKRDAFDFAAACKDFEAGACWSIDGLGMDEYRS